MQQIITGIQQVGIGVTDVDTAWPWYRKQFGMDVPVFDDVAEATLMKQYTGNKIYSRRAVLAMNMKGGGGFEIWQFKNRRPLFPPHHSRIGDLGINAIKIKTANSSAAHHRFKSTFPESVSELCSVSSTGESFWVDDPFGNRFQVVEDESWFSGRTGHTGGVCGVILGVSDIDVSLPLYTDVLGFTEILYDETGTFRDLPEGKKYRRCCLKKSQKNCGAFSRLLGNIQIELVQMLTDEPRKLYDRRFWGDPGFIHVCFDVNDMDRLKHKCENLGYSFTVDSADSFDMGEAAGRFSYIEDPDGTLIEFVQTHKLPVLKRWGWYIHLNKRSHTRPLPDWILRCLSFNRVTES